MATTGEENKQPTESAPGSTGVFLRRASGVYRSWSPFDGWTYNVLAMNVVVMIGFTYYSATYLFPGGSLPWAILICGIFCILEGITYAILTATMPRSGGDYIYQSRILGGAIGSVISFTAIVSAGAMWMAIAGWFGSTLCVAPFLVLIGGTYDIQWMSDLGEWFITPAGFFVMTLIVIAWAALVNIWGMRLYALLQRWFWIVGAICLGVMLVVLAMNDHASFVDKFNSFMATNFNQSDAYQNVLTTAKDQGYAPGGGGGFSSTIAIIPLAAFSLIYVAWSVAQGGEIKSGNSLRAQMIQMPGAEVFSAVVAAVLSALLVSRIGTDFLGSVGFVYTEAPDAYVLPVAPLFGAFVGALAQNGALLILVAIAFNAWFWMWHPNITLAASRVMLAMSFDRILPDKVGSVNKTTHTPIFAIVIFSIICAVFGYLYSYTSFWELTLATAALNILCFGVSNLAGAVMPYRRPDLYRDSPAANWKIAGIPVITITGFIFVAFTAWILYMVLKDSAYAVNSTRSLVFMGILYVIAIVLYVIGKLRRQRQGINVNVVYAQIPVE
jgi:basic amino acid/polyamine antiporter, APA family